MCVHGAGSFVPVPGNEGQPSPETPPAARSRAISFTTAKSEGKLIETGWNTKAGQPACAGTADGERSGLRPQTVAVPNDRELALPEVLPSITLTSSRFP